VSLVQQQQQQHLSSRQRQLLSLQQQRLLQLLVLLLLLFLQLRSWLSSVSVSWSGNGSSGKMPGCLPWPSGH
jgi:uncharacterized membrane protein (DUF106 family)